MTQEECVKVGGHCWNEPGWYSLGDPRKRTCKHCGRVEKQRSDWEEDAET